MAVQLIHGLYSQTVNGSTINTTGEQSLVGTGVVASDQSDIGVDINSPIGQLNDATSVSVTMSRDQFGEELLTSMFRVSTAALNTLPLSTRSCSFANVGPNDAEVLGATLKTGETVSFDSGGLGATLVRSTNNAINYNCLTSELLIIAVSE